MKLFLIPFIRVYSLGTGDDIDLKICNANYQICCEIKPLDLQNRDQCHINQFTGGSLKDCKDFHVPKNIPPTMLVISKGTDGWKPSSIQYVFLILILQWQTVKLIHENRNWVFPSIRYLSLLRLSFASGKSVWCYLDKEWVDEYEQVPATCHLNASSMGIARRFYTT